MLSTREIANVCLLLRSICSLSKPVLQIRGNTAAGNWFKQVHWHNLSQKRTFLFTQTTRKIGNSREVDGNKS